MTKTIAFNTGRQYTAEGQYIVATLHADGTVTFMDHSRSIDGAFAWGTAYLDHFDARELQAEVMHRYDHGDYASTADSRANGLYSGGCNTRAAYDAMKAARRQPVQQQARAAAPASPVATLDLDHKGLPYRTPNKTGHGDHKFSASVRVDFDGRVYSVQVFQLRPDHVGVNKMETAVYLNGRMLPEGQRANVRLAALDAYNDAFLSAEKVAAAKVALYDAAVAGLDWAGLQQVAEGQDMDLSTPGHIEAAKRRIAEMKAAPVIADHDRESIDLTPTWSGMLPLLLANIESGSFEGRKAAEGELRRMAALADKYVAENSPAPDLVRVYRTNGVKAEGEAIFTGSPAEVSAYLRGLPLGESLEVRNARNIRSCMNKPALWEWVENLTTEAA